jgi:hypothetical protein
MYHTTFKKEYKTNFLFWGIPMFFLMHIIFYKDIIKYFHNKDWNNFLLDTSMSPLIATIGTILYTIVYLAISKPINK